MHFIYKLEKVNAVLPALSMFCDTNIKLQTSNRGEKKWYAEVYRDFKNNYVVNKKDLDFLYKSKFTRHFYSEEEIEGFYQKHLS